jgi:TnpA family transposase
MPPFIPARDGRFSVSLYKALLFLQVQSAIKSGTLNLEYSYKYRPLDAYLIDRERWQRDKPLLIERADLQAFLDPHQVLAELDAVLYQQYLTTNAHILEGQNPHIKFKKRGFSVSTPMLEQSDAEALQHYFPERDFVPLMEVLATVNRHTGWMEEFQHWQQRHHHGRPADRVVYAGVIGIGCTIGIRKMARISHPISESELENAVNWFFSVDNINAASDRVLQLMDRLELPKLLQRTPGRSHTSSDGQKFEVRVDSLNANHSFKYFGKEQGVSVYTFRDERDLLWHSLVFSAAERESAYCDEQHIILFWDDILRFIATIKLKETTASDIFRRLNSYSKQHGLYHALKAFGQILKSIFILRVIDEPGLRMSIEKLLSGIEHVHAFTRAVSVGNPREFLQAEKEDQEMAEACKRLIKNCIICWNYLYLSQKLAQIDDPAKREELLQAMAHGSAAAWGHLNLLGEYDFSEDKLQDSVGIKPPKLTD